MAGLDGRVWALVATVLEDQGQAMVAQPDQPLPLDSLQVVALVDILEVKLDIRLRPTDVTGDNFANVNALVRLCRERGAT